MDKGRPLGDKLKRGGEKEERKDAQKLIRQMENVSQQGIFLENASTLA